MKTPLSSIETNMEILLTAEKIQQRVRELAQQIAADYKGREGGLTIVGVLTGCLMFLADLARHLDLPLRIGLIQASSYRGATTTPGELEIQAGLLRDVQGRHVLLLDDILDTGQTLASAWLATSVDLAWPRRVRLPCWCASWAGCRCRSPRGDYCGFGYPLIAFVVGYGLDYNDDYRHLPYSGCAAGYLGDDRDPSVRRQPLALVPARRASEGLACPSPTRKRGMSPSPTRQRGIGSSQPDAQARWIRPTEDPRQRFGLGQTLSASASGWDSWQRQGTDEWMEPTCHASCI